MSLLRVEGLKKAFGGLLAVDDVNLEIQAGEMSSIIGPNGAGKTTFFNLVTGYLSKDSGRVFFKGDDISRLSPPQICHQGIGRAFQVSNLFPRFTAFDNVQVALMMHKRMALDFFSNARKLLRPETLKILEEVGLADQAHLLSKSLAHGDQKRLDIAIALASEPELLMLDEPTAGMNPKESFKIMDLVAGIARARGMTVVFIEHDMDIVFSISERIRVMHMGRLFAAGKPEEIRENREVKQIYLGESE
ncbi:MAG: ABC transporter ATP-binding protein [Thermodesulfobacteriota bacterium]|jgi:branched-chain amino acid transport system ATP-binding protein